MGTMTNSYRPENNPLAFNPGAARTPITIVQQTKGTDISGATVTWTPLAETYAEVKALRGSDAWKNGQFTSQKYMQVRLRYLPGVLSNMRITFPDLDGGIRTLEIQDAVNVLERNVILELLCVELDGQ